MNKITNRQAICDTLLKAAKTDPDLVVLCSDSRGSASLTPFFKEYPDQSYEVGIAEQNLVSVSAGMASCGKKVFAGLASQLSVYQELRAGMKIDVAYSKTKLP